MNLHFYKYQATGNDFILVDNREGSIALTAHEIGKICDRRFGVGGDGLILLEKDPQLDFKMVYYNSDGTQSLCGNGCRTAINLASRLGIVNGRATFSAYDGAHDAVILSNGLIRLHLNNVIDWKKLGDDIFIDTGSPHLVRFVNNLKDVHVVEEGRPIRYSDPFKPGGANVNFVELLGHNALSVRTYERGVENETLSCGTGVTAAALAAALKGYSSPVDIKVMGGSLSVEFKFSQSGIFEEIFLTGPAKMVFEGNLEL